MNVFFILSSIDVKICLVRNKGIGRIGNSIRLRIRKQFFTDRFTSFGIHTRGRLSDRSYWLNLEIYFHLRITFRLGKYERMQQVNQLLFRFSNTLRYVIDLQKYNGKILPDIYEELYRFNHWKILVIKRHILLTVFKICNNFFLFLNIQFLWFMCRCP